MSWDSSVDFDFGDSEPIDAITWDVEISTDDESTARRRRALSPSDALLELERNKAHYDGDFWGNYDLPSLALKVIDQVALAQCISAGRTWDETIEYAASQARRQSPNGGQTQWMTVAQRVLVSLVTSEERTSNYLIHDESGPIWRTQRFRILVVRSSGAEGGEHLRATEEAINLFITALDVPIEIAQIANEAQLKELIKRGALKGAVSAAHQARYQSVVYQEQIGKIVNDSIRNPREHDWIGTVPELLRDALDHVGARMRGSSELLSAVEETRSKATDPRNVVEANQLIAHIRDCRRRHEELHNLLIGARGKHRDALDDRLSRPPNTAHRVNVLKNMLVPMMERTRQDATAATDRVLAIIGGINTRLWPSLATLTDELCRPLPIPEDGELFSEPEFDDGDLDPWWEPYKSTVDSLLNAIEKPTRLSQILARAEDLAESVVDADGDPLDLAQLRAAIVHAAHRAWAPRISGRLTGERVLLAVSSGSTIDDDTLFSQDLILFFGEVVDDVTESIADQDQGAA